MALDPSGSFEEGKGTTGWCWYDTKKKQIIKTGWISATDYDCKEQYWLMHLNLIEEFRDWTIAKSKSFILVIEDYVLYETKKDAQVNSKMETCKLIGILQINSWLMGIEYFMELAAAVKNRWTDSILVYKQHLIRKGNQYYVAATGELVNRHAKDAIRHAVHFSTFKNGKGDDNATQKENRSSSGRCRTLSTK